MQVTYLTLEATREGQASYVHVHEIIDGLKRRGCEVRLYNPSYATQEKSPNLVSRVVHSLLLQGQMWGQWRKGSVLYIRGHYLAFPSAVVAKIFGIKIVHEINGPYEDLFVTYPALNKFRKILIWMQRQQYRWADMLISVTEDLRVWAARESDGKPSYLIPNGANIDLFKPDLPRPENLPDRYAIFFGGLAAWHGVPVMLDAIQHSSWPYDLDLVIIGDGPCGDKVRDAAKNNPRIHALGKKPYREIAAYVGHALVGLVPISNPGDRSSTGLFPLKLFETLACGVPVIVTDFPGQADLVRENQCGLIISPNDAAALAQSVAKLAADPQTASEMGRRGYDCIVSQHSWDKRAADTLDLIKSLKP